MKELNLNVKVCYEIKFAYIMHNIAFIISLKSFLLDRSVAITWRVKYNKLHKSINASLKY